MKQSELANVCESPHLSPREIQVLKLSGAGYTTNQIARILGVSFHTVTDYRRRAFVKLTAFSVPHALVIAHQLGLLNVGEIDPIRAPNLRG